VHKKHEQKRVNMQDAHYVSNSSGVNARHP